MATASIRTTPLGEAYTNRGATLKTTPRPAPKRLSKSTPNRRAVIIGGGISGTLTALELARSQWDVTLLEAKYFGEGSSSRTAAGIRQQFSTPDTVLGMMYSVEQYLQLQAMLDGQKLLVQNGYLFLSEQEDHWAHAQRRVQMQRDVGLHDVHALDRQDLIKEFPYLNPETCLGGTWCSSDGFLRPEVIYGEARRIAQEIGAKFFANAPVTGAKLRGDQLASVETPKGAFEADLFLDCTNAWTYRLAQILGAALLPVSPLKRYLWFLQRDPEVTLPHDLTKMPMIISPRGAYCRPENNDKILFAKITESIPEPNFKHEDQDHIDPRFFHQGVDDESPIIHALLELGQYIPDLIEFGGFAATTCGYYGSTPDHNPFLDFDPNLRNLIRLVGHSGHGAMFGPFTAFVAKCLAEAGHSLSSVRLDNGQAVSLAAFRTGRTFNHSENLVI